MLKIILALCFFSVFAAQSPSHAGPKEKLYAKFEVRRPSVDGYIKLLNHEDAAERFDAIEELGAYRSGALKAIPAIITRLEDKEPVVVARAWIALEQIDPEFKSVNLGCEYTYDNVKSTVDNVPIRRLRIEMWTSFLAFARKDCWPPGQQSNQE